MSLPVLTFGREFGSGGHLIAHKVAETLQIPFYDRALIALAAKQTGLSEDYIRQTEQKPTPSVLYTFYMSAQSLPMSDQVFLAQSNVIRQAAAEGPCVIVGRCADYLLHGRARCLNLFIHAPLEQRTQRVKTDYQAEAQNYRSFVLREDKRRAAYYARWTGQVWGKVQNYHLAVNSEIGLDTAAELICDLARKEDRP